jgi:hypothetical protein
MKMKVFEGTYSEESMYEDLTDDIFIVLSDLEDCPNDPMGFKPGIFRVIITQEKK